MSTFRIKPEGIQQTKKNLLRVFVPIIFLCAAVGIIIGTLTSKSTDTGPVFFFIFIPILTGFFVFVTYRAIQRAVKGLQSLQISIDEDRISRTQNNMADLVIDKDEIKEITESPKGDFIIRTHSYQRFIFISRYTERADTLKPMLEKLAPIHVKKQGAAPYLVVLLIFGATLAVLAVFLMAEIAWVIIGSGILMILIILMVIVMNLLNKALEMRVRMGSLFLLFFVIWIINRLLPVIETL